jgi:hypothetical protein
MEEKDDRGDDIISWRHACQIEDRQNRLFCSSSPTIDFSSKSSFQILEPIAFEDQRILRPLVLRI